ncbi:MULTISPECIES: 2-phosphosulfolactate phosphatase [Paenibacillus]|uniref:Probable 2-phosphosulfolactate phosphatase n=1 Tax=Paenibacillus albilobatus TaxID=2716884 RepID=A0A919XKY0_9BACL|nr:MULTISPECIES: 2-phosphosulfolactate phosphatase [Paenibacillus]GIO34624.1 putative 2-phosphosulfolactate phosphatase [Paenibacillus albilobatus]
MPIRIVQGHKHTLEASHINVVIDVIRAFTVAHYAFRRGLRGIVLAGTVDEAFLLKKRNPAFLLAGEIRGLPIPGFELDNSPARLQTFDFEGKYMIQKTTNGVAATLNALHAEHVFVTGFTNARTTAEFIKRNLWKYDDLTIHLIASHPTGDDDLACAQYISGILEGANPISAERTIKRIRGSEAAQKFYDREQPEFLKEDISCCVQELPSDFVMKVRVVGGAPIIEKVPTGDGGI